MDIESPLFNSAMELFAHSISHYNGKNELDRKLVILHLANSVELILKDLLINSDVSIYKNPKETISIQGCFAELGKKNLKLDHLNKIEMLIDERNALQHRFGSPNELTTIYYMRITKEFFSYILKNHYNSDFNEVINQFGNKEDLSLFEIGESTNLNEIDKLSKLSKEHPLGACLSAWSYLEKIINDFSNDIGFNFKNKNILSGIYLNNLFESIDMDLSNELKAKISKARKIRNMAAHGRLEPSISDVKEILGIIKDIESHIESINKEEVKNKVKILKKEMNTLMKEVEDIDMNSIIKDEELKQFISQVDLKDILSNENLIKGIQEIELSKDQPKK